MKYHLFAKLCRTAYKRNERIIEELEKMWFEKENIAIIEEDTMKCIVIFNGIRQYVVFKGTSTWQEVLIDLSAVPVNFQGIRGKVHSGVWIAATKFYNKLSKVLDPAKYTYFVGHSLGAGLAAYIVSMLMSRGKINLAREVILIGSFKLGDAAYAEWLTSKVNVTLIQNNMDIICNILQKPYVRVATKHYYFDRNEKLIENPSNSTMFFDRLACYTKGKFKELAIDHTSESYYNVLKAVDL